MNAHKRIHMYTYVSVHVTTGHNRVSKKRKLSHAASFIYFPTLEISHCILTLFTVMCRSLASSLCAFMCRGVDARRTFLLDQPGHWAKVCPPTSSLFGFQHDWRPETFGNLFITLGGVTKKKKTQNRKRMGVFLPPTAHSVLGYFFPFLSWILEQIIPCPCPNGTIWMFLFPVLQRGCVIISRVHSDVLVPTPLSTLA